MKVVFVITEAENYAIQLFSAILKQKGHQVHLIFDPKLFNTDEISMPFLAKLFDIRKQNIAKIKKINPDLIGFSVYTHDYQWALGMARIIKKEIPDTPIIFGGIHCILCPEQVIKEDCVDMVCAGEGEEALIELIDLWEKGFRVNSCVTEIKNLWWKLSNNFIHKNPLRSLIQDLDSLPFIDRDILYEQKPVFKKDYSISTGRGCPFACTYCASDALRRTYQEKGLGKYVRQRSVENVIQELILAKLKYKPRSIYFTDDVFTMNTVWLRDFVLPYRQLINLPFYCTANPGTIKDEELNLLADCGCQMIGFGMQSCNEEYRKLYLKRGGTNERIIEVSDMCHRPGIHFSFDHIFNLPNENTGNQDEAVSFYNRTRPDIINTFDMTYLPKIELNKYLSEKERSDVDNGYSRTGMFIRGESYLPSIFCLLPLLPPGWVRFIVDKGLARFIRLPFWIRLLLKDIKRLMISRYSDVFFPIRLLLANIKDNILIKCGLH